MSAPNQQAGSLMDMVMARLAQVETEPRDVMMELRRELSQPHEEKDHIIATMQSHVASLDEHSLTILYLRKRGWTPTRIATAMNADVAHIRSTIARIFADMRMRTFAS